MLSSMHFSQNRLAIIDQRKLPHEEVWIDCTDLESVAVAIEDMAVRGAPAIGCAAAFGLGLHASSLRFGRWQENRAAFESGYARMARTRPTAVNLFYAIDRIRGAVSKIDPHTEMARVSAEINDVAQAIWDEDVHTCASIGKNGAEFLGASASGLRILTHCNTGFLATAGIGTALGVIATLHRQGKLAHVFADETRPWLQGARLTAWELKKAGIPHTLIADSAAASVMKNGGVDCVIVGADRIARNGDTANKIGTYPLAIAARHHGVKFYVAAPLSTFDADLATGADIAIERRPAHEITHFRDQPVAPMGTEAFNPSFDVTPFSLIDGIFTERGVVRF